MTPYKAALFDFDGVLLHSMATWDEVVLDAVKKSGGVCKPDVLHGSSGLTVRERMDKCFRASQLQLDDDAITELAAKAWKEGARRLEDAPKLVDGVASYVSFLDHGGIPLGVVSTSGRGFITRVLEGYDLLACFRILVAFDDVTKTKPDPEPYLIGLQKLGTSATETLVFEDSLHGIAAARSAGCDVVGVTTSESEAELVQAGALFSVKDFHDSRLHSLFGLP